MALVCDFRVVGPVQTNCYFLYHGTSIKNAQNQPCYALRQRATEKKKKEFFKSDGISGTGSKLCGQCEQTFKDDASKAIYDKYLEYIRRKEIMDEAKGMYDLSGELSPEQITDFVRRLTHDIPALFLFKNFFNKIGYHSFFIRIKCKKIRR